MTNQRITFSSEGQKFIDGKMKKEEFCVFFDEFKKNMKSVLDEFEKAVSPALYFNDGAKKVSEKNLAFKAIYEDIDRGIRIIDAGLSLDSMEKFKKGYATITSAADKMENFKTDISALANSISM